MPNTSIYKSHRQSKESKGKQIKNQGDNNKLGTKNY